MAKILLVEDEHALSDSVIQCLEPKLHRVEWAMTVDEARARLAVSDYDIILLDWNLPDGEGVEILRYYRASGGSAAVLMLTAKSDIENKETGFTAGADDYLTKPFSLRELVARIEALLRRSRQVAETMLKAGNISLHPETYKVFRGDEEIRLLPKEYALLEFLMRHPRQVFSPDNLLERVWSSDSESMPDAVITTVKRLRSKIDTPGCPSVVETIRGVGYRLRETLA